MQFRVIVVTDPPTHKQDRLKYIAPQLARRVISSIHNASRTHLKEFNGTQYAVEF